MNKWDKMARLIDADKLYEKMTKLAQDMCHDCTDTDCYDCIMKNVIEKVLEGWSWGEVENAPMVEERKKSRWIALEQSGFFAREYKCESCESVVDMNCYTRGCDYDYCPYCGAEMEGEDAS